MALNAIFDNADRLSLPVIAGKASGDPVRIGGATGLNGVCLTKRSTTAAPEGDNPDGYASVALTGAYTFTVAFAITNIGDPVYILADGSALTATASGNYLFGHALTTKAAPSGLLTVRLAN